MNDKHEAGKDANQPQTVTARIGHLSPKVRKQIEKITRIIRGSFGHGEGKMPEAGQITRIALTAPLTVEAEAESYSFAIMVNLPECADDTHWAFTKRLIAGEIGADRSVTLTVTATAKDVPATAITLYDAATDTPLNARELPRQPIDRNLH